MSEQAAASPGGAGHGAGTHVMSPDEVRAHVRVYVTVFVNLAILTVATVGAHYLHVPIGLAVAIALLIATVKGSLVALFFMHLKGEVRAIMWALLLTSVFFLALITIPLSWYLDGPGYTTIERPAAHATATHEGH